MIVMVGLAQSAPQNTNEVVRTVTTQLQPLISDAVAKALASFNSVSTSSVSSFGSSSGFGSSSAAGAARGLTEDEELEYNRKLSANAQYNYNYKVNDPDASTFMAHEESREGENVQGQYSYVDSTGALVTVTYTAGPDGYNEDRTVQEGAVSGHRCCQDSSPQTCSQTCSSQSCSSCGPVCSDPARSVQTSSSSVEGLFAGDNSVRINTPEFNIEY